MLAGSAAAIAAFIVFLFIKWNSTLEKEAKRRIQGLYGSERKTSELEKSYEAMKQYLDEVLEELKRMPYA